MSLMMVSAFTAEAAANTQADAIAPSKNFIFNPVPKIGPCHRWMQNHRF